jgi:hypothetical protein
MNCTIAIPKESKTDNFFEWYYGYLPETIKKDYQNEHNL